MRWLLQSICVLACQACTTLPGRPSRLESHTPAHVSPRVQDERVFHAAGTRQGPNPSLMFSLSHSWPLTSCGACSEATQGHDGISRDVLLLRLLLHLFSGEGYGSNSCIPNITSASRRSFVSSTPSILIFQLVCSSLSGSSALFQACNLSKPRMRIFWRTFLHSEVAPPIST